MTWLIPAPSSKNNTTTVDVQTLARVECHPSMSQPAVGALPYVGMATQYLGFEVQVVGDLYVRYKVVVVILLTP